MAAVREAIGGNSVCLATGTASGKSALFFAAGIHILSQRYKARVLAMYPTRALGREQAERWRDAFRKAELPFTVGVIDGGVPRPSREDILMQHDVIIMTPDVVHAWLLPSLGSKTVRIFFQHLRLVVVDEIHTYTGVMGTNSAFLFRRLAHAAHVLGSGFRIVAASATIENPSAHLEKLFGRAFVVIGPEQDTSPRHAVTFDFVEPPSGKDRLQAVAQLLRQIAISEGVRAIAFLDSRLQVEVLGSILQRADDLDEANLEAHMDDMLASGILPYRSGYEERDRAAIQEGLTTGKLCGVVSTSALELGMDIPNLDVAVLVGVPQLQTSFLQRIGRIGRHRPGRVIVVHSGTAADDAIFENPTQLFDRPLTEAVLYLEHPRAQYIHALCLASMGGEHDLALNLPYGDSEEFELADVVSWPEGFAEICQAERQNRPPRDLEWMKIEAGGNPHHTYHLRDVERQFTVEMRSLSDISRLGRVSYSQALREAYPGAVYRYMGRSYRVTGVYTSSNRIEVRPERQYYTRPLTVQPKLYPRLEPERGDRVWRAREGWMAECEILVWEAVTGFVERRGSAKHEFSYPLMHHLDLRDVYYASSSFQRYYKTHGVVFHHPAFQGAERLSELAELLLEAFSFVVPFDTQDIGVGIGRWAAEGRHGSKADSVHFIALYDRVYGSLHLAARIMEDGVLARVAEQMSRFRTFRHHRAFSSPGLAEVADAWMASLREPATLERAEVAVSESQNSSEDKVRVILPGSVGYAIKAGREYEVRDVFYTPKGLQYRGIYRNDRDHEDCDVQLEAHMVDGIPGVTRYGWYDLNTGLVTEGG